MKEQNDRYTAPLLVELGDIGWLRQRSGARLLHA